MQLPDPGLALIDSKACHSKLLHKLPLLLTAFAFGITSHVSTLDCISSHCIDRNCILHPKIMQHCLFRTQQSSYKGEHRNERQLDTRSLNFHKHNTLILPCIVRAFSAVLILPHSALLPHLRQPQPPWGHSRTTSWCANSTSHTLTLLCTCTLGSPSPLGSPLYHFMVRMPHRRQAFRAAYPSQFGLYATPAAQQALSRCYGRLVTLMADTAEGSRCGRFGSGRDGKQAQGVK